MTRIAIKILIVLMILGLLFVPAKHAFTQAIGSNQIYLPLVMNAVTSEETPAAGCEGICGRVTHNGNPAVGTPLDLYRYNGERSVYISTRKTDINGGYSFTGVPTLENGNIYYVLYENESDNNMDQRLGIWITRDLENYTAGENVRIGDFDVMDVVLLAPTPGAELALPATFQWAKRSATPWDSYKFAMFGLEGRDPFFTSQNQLGYTDSYTLQALPYGFYPGESYGWAVYVYSPDGGLGASFWARYVAFSGAKGSAPQKTSAGQFAGWMDPRHPENK